MFHGIFNFMDIISFILMTPFLLYNPKLTILLFQIVQSVFLVLHLMILVLLYRLFFFYITMFALQWCSRFLEFSFFAGSHDCYVSPAAPSPSEPRALANMSLHPPVPSNHHPMITRGKAGIVKPRSHHAMTILSSNQFIQALLVTKEPKGFKSAAKHLKWLSAMDDEIHALQRNGTWTFVPRPQSHNVVGCR